LAGDVKRDHKRHLSEDNTTQAALAKMQATVQSLVATVAKLKEEDRKDDSSMDSESVVEEQHAMEHHQSRNGKVRNHRDHRRGDVKVSHRRDVFSPRVVYLNEPMHYEDDHYFSRRPAPFRPPSRYFFTHDDYGY
jgi:hypothetical protein